MGKRASGPSTAQRRMELEKAFGLLFLEKLNTPVSLSIYLQAIAGEWIDIVNRSINPDNYIRVEDFAIDYQAISLFRKVTWDIGVDREAAALETYIEAEDHCLKTNERLYSAEFSDIGRTDDSLLVKRIAEQVKKNLGRLRRRDLEQLDTYVGFGNGSTPLVKGERRSYTVKYGLTTWTTTAAAMSYGIFCLPPHLLVRDFIVSKAQKLSFVPKDAKTSRTIEIQPELNLFVQRGIGKLLKGRLRACGCVIDTTAYNEHCAARGSRDGSFTTLDLSSASDTLACATVFRLLPDDWFALLEMFRTTHITVNNQVNELQKFSAMGNGYTWELETVIFYSLLQVVCGENNEVNAYGDDLVFPTEYTDAVVAALELLGFKVNFRKTFKSGVFRESCGADFFEGHEVRPFFLRSGADDDLEGAAYSAANNLVLWANKLNDLDSRRAALRKAWFLLFNSVRRQCRNIVPAAEDERGALQPRDGGFIGSRKYLRSCKMIERAKEQLAQDQHDGIPFITRMRTPCDPYKRRYGTYVATLAGIDMSRQPHGEYLRTRRFSQVGVAFNFPDVSL